MNGDKMNGVIINRAWAMPSKDTFKIKPISELLRRYVGEGLNWIDPFAGDNSPAEVTNDLNPKKKTLFHRSACEFVSEIAGCYDGVLFDPPYSLRQLKECYEQVGVKMFKDDSTRFPQNVKELIVPKLNAGAIAITFGWNSQGFGKNLGFEVIEILLVAHGRSHNDTIVVVEKKITNDPNVQECDATGMTKEQKVDNQKNKVEMIKEFLKEYYEWDENEWEPQQAFAQVSMSDMEQLISTFLAAQQSTVQGEGWISAADSLPELETKVIVARPNQYSDKTDILMAYLHDSGEAGRSCGRLGDCDWLYGKYWSLPAVVKLNTITHWQPLPQLPSTP